MNNGSDYCKQISQQNHLVQGATNNNNNVHMIRVRHGRVVEFFFMCSALNYRKIKIIVYLKHFYLGSMLINSICKKMYVLKFCVGDL